MFGLCGVCGFTVQCPRHVRNTTCVHATCYVRFDVDLRELQAAMEIGDGEKALKFYQLVLRNDPDQADVGKQYKGLKKLLKLLKEADEKLTKY